LARGEQSADHDVVQAQGDPFAVVGLARDGFGWAGGAAVFGRLRAAWRETGGWLYRGDGRCGFCGRCGQNTWYPVHRASSLSYRESARRVQIGAYMRAANGWLTSLCDLRPS